MSSVFPNIRDFSDESAFGIRWTKYWSFSSSISPSNEHPGLISFRMDRLDLLAVQPLHIRWPKYWSFSSSISPSNEYSGLISFRIGWFDLLTVQGPLKSLLQHHNLKASVLQCSVSFMVQLSHLYMTTGKNTALTIWTFVSKVNSLLSTVSRFVIAFLPRSKHF